MWSKTDWEVLLVFGLTSIGISFVCWLYFKNLPPWVDKAILGVPALEQNLSANPSLFILPSNKEKAFFSRLIKADSIQLHYFELEDSIHIQINSLQLIPDTTINQALILSDYQPIAKHIIKHEIGELIEWQIRPGIRLGITISE